MGKVFLRLDCVADNQFLRRCYTAAGFLDRGEIEAGGTRIRLARCDCSNLKNASVWILNLARTISGRT